MISEQAVALMTQSEKMGRTTQMLLILEWFQRPVEVGHGYRICIALNLKNGNICELAKT